jgi:hypothetical protein
MAGASVSRPDAPARATGDRVRPGYHDYPHCLLNEPRAVVALQVTPLRTGSGQTPTLRSAPVCLPPPDADMVRERVRWPGSPMALNRLDNSKVILPTNRDTLVTEKWKNGATKPKNGYVGANSR